jgi:phage tail sheath protein FI
MPDYRTPAVYIEELPAVGPIAGVGTSTPVIIGPAANGPTNVPTKITNWTMFTDTFGSYLVTPRRYAAHAVRGFFANGGTIAYFTRVSTAAPAKVDLNDRGVNNGIAIHVEGLTQGTAGNGIKVTVADAQIVPAGNNCAVFKGQAPLAAASGNLIQLQNLADAQLFAPSDWLTIVGSAERVQVNRIFQDQIVLKSNLGAVYNAGQVRVADLAINQKSFRIANGAGIEPGSVIQIAQGGNNENHVVDGVAGSFIILGGNGVTQAFTLAQADAAVTITSYEFSLTVTPVIGPAEPINDKLSMDSRHSRYFARVFASGLVAVSQPAAPSVEIPPANRPKVGQSVLAGGADDNLLNIGLNQYNAALAALEKVDDISIVCAPDATDGGTQAALVAHCEKMADRFAILDSAFNASVFGPGSVLTQRQTVESARGYAALYYPWVQINDPNSLTGNDTMLVPTSGHMAGIYARSDEQRGVHKAPANEMITLGVGLERILDDAQQGELNIQGVNVHRVFAGKSRPVVWGARTTCPKDEVPWRYINVRRLFIYVEQSIKLGIHWAVFEPNDPGLWKKLDRTITEFLTRVWRSGALFGTKASEAFYVKIDDELNPEPIRALGQVIIEIGLAPVRPAEFVIVRIGMWNGGSQISET